MGLGGSIGKALSGAWNFATSDLSKALSIMNPTMWGSTALGTIQSISPYKMLHKSGSSNRDLESMTAADLAASRLRLEGMSKDAYNRYLYGGISKGAVKDIRNREAIRKAQAAEALGKAGIGDSSTAVDTKRSISSMTVQELDAARDREFGKAMQALGMSWEASQIVSAMNRADREATSQAFIQTMSALGNLAGTLSSSSRG